MLRATIILSGRVQGVGCRSFVQSIARELGVNGNVKNLPDGSVQIICECEDENIFEKFTEAIRKGNFLIRVDEMKPVEKRTVEKPGYKSFQIEY